MYNERLEEYEWHFTVSNFLGAYFHQDISAINVFLSMVIHVPQQEQPEKASKTNKSFALDDLVDKKAVPFALVIFLLACAYSGIASFLALYAQEINLVKAASTFFILYAGLMFVFRPFTGVWAGRYGAKKIVYPCIVLFAIGMVMLSLASDRCHYDYRRCHYWNRIWVSYSNPTNTDY